MEFICVCYEVEMYILSKLKYILFILIKYLYVTKIKMNLGRHGLVMLPGKNVFIFFYFRVKFSRV